jgi:serine/threonine protein kinase/WD40 repeat protein
MNEPSHLETIFLKALEFNDTNERNAYLEEICVQDPKLREEVERLIQSHQESGSFLEPSPSSLPMTKMRCTAMRSESVLKAMQGVIGDAVSVTLRDEELPEPVQRVSSTEIPVGQSEERYQLQGEIARGGMGAILKGRDKDLGRDLAVKVLLESHRDKPEVIQRFVEEAQIGGQLQHPGIAPVYELGQFEDQRPYFTMKLVKGKTLAALLAERNSLDDDRSKLIGIFEQVCQTMAYAHSRGVIHRDLKPSNIMVGAFGEVQVMDWGLAKVLKSGGVADETRPANLAKNQSIIETLRSGGSDTPFAAGSQTQMGSVMGTPAYMPPEQALGEIDRLDERCDVFGLGAILCEILTGHPPYTADDPVELYRMATRGKLDDCFQRLDECGGDNELADIARHCVSPDPQDRPLNAGVLANTITSHLEAVESRLREAEIERATQTARAAEERKRRKVSLAFSSAILILIAVLGGGGVWFFQQQALAAERMAMQEKEQAKVEREAREKVRESLYGAQINFANTAIEAGDLRTAKRTLDSWIPDDDDTDFRGFEWHMLKRRCWEPIEVRDLNWQQSHAEYMAPNPASSFGQQLSGDRTKYADLVNDPSGVTTLRVRELETGDRVNDISLGKLPKAPRANSKQTYFTLNHSGTLAAVFLLDVKKPTSKTVAIVDVAKGEIVLKHVLKDSEITKGGRLTFVDDSKAVVVTEFRVGDRPRNEYAVFLEGEIVVSRLDMTTGEIRWTQKLEDAITPIGRPVVSPEGKLFAINVVDTVELRKSVRILDTNTGRQTVRVHLPENLANGDLEFSPDGKCIATCTAESNFLQPGRPTSNGNRFCVWDVDTGRMITNAAAANGFCDVIFSSDGSLAVAGARMSERPEVIHVASGKVLGRFHPESASVVRFSTDNRFLECIDHRGILRKYEIARNPFRGGEFDITDNVGVYGISGDGSRFARLVNQKGGQLRLTVFDARGVLQHSSPTPVDNLYDKMAFRSQTLVLNQNGSRATMGESKEPRVIILDLTAKNDDWHTLYRGLEVEKIHKLISSPTDSRVAAIFGEPRKKGLEPTSRREESLFDQATADREKLRIKVWDLESDREVQLPQINAPLDAAFSYDGKILAIADLPKNSGPIVIHLIDLVGREIVQSFDLPKSRWISQMEFRWDDQLLACVSPREGLIYLCDRISKTTRSVASGTVRDDSSVAFCDDQTRIFVMTDFKMGRHLRIWNTTTGSLTFEELYAGDSNGIPLRIRFVPELDRVVGWAFAGPALFWDGRPLETKAY